MRCCSNVQLVIGLTQVALLAFWLACILSLISLIPNPYGQTILWIGGLVLLVHWVEYVFAKSRVFERSAENTGFILTILFAFDYWLPVLKRPD